jgi:DNA primase small subunit
MKIVDELDILFHTTSEKRKPPNKEEIDVSAQDFVREIFTKYYEAHCNEIMPPSSLEQREFGFILNKEKMMIRHKNFSSPHELRRFIVTNTPSDVYYSSAYYEHPTEPMERKNWLGADLVFDIDSDHLDTPCKKEHDFWTCEICGNSGRGEKPAICSNCKGTKFKMEAWLCENCLDAAKNEAEKLLDFLTSDLGFQPEKTMTCFSGQRGYHVHIEESEIRLLNQDGRREIADYITATGIKVESHGFGDTGAKRRGPSLDDLGWSGRITRGVYDILSLTSVEEFQNVFGLPKNTAKSLGTRRNTILQAMEQAIQWQAGNVSQEAWKMLASRAARKQASLIDTVVTTDIHRLIRLPQTLHGKTGLKSVQVPAERLQSFDPLRDAVAFKEGTLQVFVNDAPSFRIEDEVFGPYYQELVEIPMAAAVYLLCKKAAKLIDD